MSILSFSRQASVWYIFADHELKNKYLPDNLCVTLPCLQKVWIIAWCQTDIICKWGAEKVLTYHRRMRTEKSPFGNNHSNNYLKHILSPTSSWMFKLVVKSLSGGGGEFENQPCPVWDSGTVGWRVAPYTERWQVRFLVKAYTQGAGLTPVGQGVYGRQPIDVSYNILSMF